jgi:membrane fusion protein, multidrug efflux system
MNPSTNGATLQEPSRVKALTKEPITKESTTKRQAKGKKPLVRWLALPVVILLVITGVKYWLYSKGVISKQDLDNAQFQSEGNEATYNANVAAVNVAEANIQTAKAQEKAAAAQVEVASAQVQNAELQLSYTTVYSSTDGRVAQKTFETGQRVAAGQAGLSISEPDDWVVANFKETQLGRIRPGQPVEIGVDALPKHKFTGKVDSFQSGTGAVFALLPPDNATGNFTKIVQRVPVKILFDPASIRGYEQLIVPGLSVDPKIRVKPKA